MEENASKSSTNTSIFDPFVAIPMNNSDKLTSHTDPMPIASVENSPGHVKSKRTSVHTNPPPKTEAFQVKSGVWSDSLNRHNWTQESQLSRHWRCWLFDGCIRIEQGTFAFTRHGNCHGQE